MTNQEQYELIWEKAKKYDRLVGVLDKIRAEIDNVLSDGMIHKQTVLGIIDKYKAENPTGSEIDKVDCENTKCENCNNHGYCDYESGRK